MRERKRAGLILSVFMVIALTTLLPGLSTAGSLEPSGPPGPTMKTLDQVPPTWDQKLSASDGSDPCNSSRFKCVLGNAAVLDKETGLVWERQPQNPNGAPDFVESVQYCANLDLGGRKGWHLPTIEQLTSLVDTSVTGSPKLPNGHPFLNVSAEGFYFALPAGFNWGVVSVGLVSFGTGDATVSFSVGCTDGGCGFEHQWCVRGGQGY